MRINIDLSKTEYDQLIEIAHRERRHPRDEIVVLAMRALKEQVERERSTQGVTNGDDEPQQAAQV
jgi:hypothetical protein